MLKQSPNISFVPSLFPHTTPASVPIRLPSLGTLLGGDDPAHLNPDPRQARKMQDRRIIHLRKPKTREPWRDCSVTRLA